ncbi:MAG: N-acetylmuramoyl-L-alanine amidase [Bacteriovoracaceae bacterium]|nr:N-acetylmuramoyl-L-alanine amidase [Bacteriovoracaceae bacterium]
MENLSIKCRIFFFILSLFFPSLLFGQTILIDPGHGGNDLGAVTKFTRKLDKKNSRIETIYEKDLSLKLALLVKERLSPLFMVYLTRTEDYPVGLHDRALMAEKIKADIFLSIHFNSSTEKEASGIETFYLDNHQDKAVKKVEVVENVGIESGKEEDLVNHILIDLAIKMTSSSSKKLAAMIHGQSFKYIKKKYAIKNRGFKPGLLYVLALSKRPGVLIEAGFISNPKELGLLKQENYLETYASGIAEGVKLYFQENLTKSRSEIPKKRGQKMKSH